jgi:predicted HTH domain antitoxin
MQVTVEVPDGMVAALTSVYENPGQAFLEAAALEAFRERRITEYELRKLLGMSSRFELHAFLKQRQIETYTAEDFEHDFANLRPLAPKA